MKSCMQHEWTIALKCGTMSGQAHDNYRESQDHHINLGLGGACFQQDFDSITHSSVIRC